MGARAQLALALALHLAGVRVPGVGRGGGKGAAEAWARAGAHARRRAEMCASSRAPNGAARAVGLDVGGCAELLLRGGVKADALDPDCLDFKGERARRRGRASGLASTGDGRQILEGLRLG
jgi:hypothetical protein